MKTIELNDDDWARLKRNLMNGSVDDALKDYTPPVKLTHGTEYITYEKLTDILHAIRNLHNFSVIPRNIDVFITRKGKDNDES